MLIGMQRSDHYWDIHVECSLVGCCMMEMQGSDTLLAQPVGCLVVWECNVTQYWDTL